MPGPRNHLAIWSGALEPEVVRRHRHDGVLVQQRDQRVDVVALERVDVAGQQRLLLGVRRVGVVVGVEVALASVARARCSALLTDATRGVEQLGHLARLPAQHLAQDEHGALARRQVLEGGDEGQPDRSRGRRDLGRVAVVGRRPGRRRSAGTQACSGSSAPGERCSAVPTTARGPSAGPGAGGRAACRGRRWWRCGTATTAATSGPRSGRSPSTPGPSSPARRPRPRSRSRASGSSSRSARAGTARGRSRPRLPGSSQFAGCGFGYR